MYVDKDGSPLGKLSEQLAVLPVRKARRKELSALVDRAVKLEAENEALKRERDLFKAGHTRYRKLYRAECDRVDALLAKDKDGWVLDENQQWRKVEKGKYV